MMSSLPLTGVILAGGQATRMGGIDKGLVTLAGKPLYRHVLERLSPQVNELIIIANRHQTEYQRAGVPVVSDSLPGYQGPLAGMLTGLEQAKHEWVLFSSCDTPLLPLDLGKILLTQRQQRYIAYAHDGERAHPTLALIHRCMLSPLQNFLASGERKIILFFNKMDAIAVCFSDKSAFYNVNTPTEKQILEAKFNQAKQ